MSLCRECEPDITKLGLDLRSISCYRFIDCNVHQFFKKSLRNRCEPVEYRFNLSRHWHVGRMKDLKLSREAQGDPKEILPRQIIANG